MCPLQKPRKATQHLGLRSADTVRSEATGREEMSDGVGHVVSLLKSITLGECLRRKPPCQVVSFHSDTRVGDALRMLEKVGIKSAPVFDRRTNAFLGFMDRREVLALLLDLANVRAISSDERAYRLRIAGRHLQSATLDSLWSLEDGELVHQTNERVSVYELVRFMSGREVKGRQVCHRVGMFDFVDDASGCGWGSFPPLDIDNQFGELTQDRVSEEYWSDISGEGGGRSNNNTSETDSGHVVGRKLQVTAVVSQSDVLRLVYHNRRNCQNFFDASLVSLGLAKKTVVCVPCDMPTMNAFATMISYDVSNLGVVDQRNGGVLVAALKASDFISLSPEEFGVLAMPVYQYIILHAIRGGMPGGLASRHECLNDWGVKGGELDRGPKMACVSAEATLRHVVEALLEERSDAVFVLDANRRPQGIVTKTDVLRLITG